MWSKLLTRLQSAPGRRLLGWASGAYAAGMLALLVAMLQWGDAVWLATLLLYVPRWPWGVGAVLLLIAAVVGRHRIAAVLSLGALGIVVGPMMGFNLPLTSWFRSSSGHPTLRIVTFNAGRTTPLARLERFIAQVQPGSAAEEAGLQGLQFRVEWSDSTVRFRDVVRGDVIADSTEWTLSYEADSVAATVVLLGSGTTALAPGTMDSLLSLRFALPDSVQESSIRFGLSKVVGALGVAGGDDAGLAVRPDSHFVSLEVGEANFLASATTLDLGRVAVGDTAIAELTVSNPAGSIPLLVYPVTADVPAFSVQPDSLIVPPDSSVSVTVRFAPSDTLFSALEASLVFVHNGVTGADTVRVSAIGEGGRGDVARDGVVDVVDLVQALDFVLLRGEPDSLQVRSADLNPFPEGNGELDVRDLTVLSHGIVNGMWPDSIALPVLGSEPEMSPSLIAEGAGERSKSIVLDATWTLTLETDIPVRALQAVLRARDVASVRATSATKETSSLVTLFTQTQSEVRVLAYRADGGLLEAGKYQLLEVEPEGNGALVTPVYVIGVDEELKRVPVAVAGFGGGSDEGEVPGESLRLGVPYPNPVRFSVGERLRRPRAGRPSDGRGRAAVFNVLGQRVRNLPLPNEDESILEWDGRDELGGHVAPGIYFIRLEGVTAPVRSAVVLR